MLIITILRDHLAIPQPMTSPQQRSTPLSAEATCHRSLVVPTVLTCCIAQPPMTQCYKMRHMSVSLLKDERVNGQRGPDIASGGDCPMTCWHDLDLESPVPATLPSV